jgi:acetyl esterase/lipase
VTLTDDQQSIAWPPPAHLPPTEPNIDVWGVRRYEGLTYASTLGYRPRLLDLYVPPAAGPVPVVVWIHGGGWLMGDRRYPPPTITAAQLFGAIVSAGLAVATIDYRHSLEAPFPAQIHDVKAAIRYLRRYAGVLGVDDTRLGVWGESAGGHLAALAALAPAHDPVLEGLEGIVDESSAVQAVVDWYGVSDLEALLGWTAPELYADVVPFDNPFESLLGGMTDDLPALARAASPVTYVVPTDTPFLLVHGTLDALVPFSQSERLAELLRAEGVDVTLTPVDGADHIFLGIEDPTVIIASGVAFLADRLGARER